MNIENAKIIRNQSLKAIENLSLILSTINNNESEDYYKIKKTIGEFIGEIDYHLILPTEELYPELSI